MFKKIIIFIVAIAAIQSTPLAADAFSSNSILNPSLEESDIYGMPEYWLSNFWGENQAVFTYPVAGFEGERAAKVEITEYTNGDAKWYFEDVDAIPGEDYIFSNSYRSNVSSEIDIRYQKTDGTYQYIWVENLPPSADWQDFQTTITVPDGVDSFTIFHLIQGVGELTVDDFSLISAIDDPNKFDQGMVSLTFDDGWFSQYTNGIPILDGAEVKGTFFIETEDALAQTAYNSVLNPSLEESDIYGMPEYWLSNFWGENQAVFTYPVAGFEGERAAKVEITEYTNGDAKWYFEDVSVIPGEDYIFSNSYRSNVSSEIDIRYQKTDGTYQYIWVENLPPSADWQDFQTTITVPDGVDSFTIFHLIQEVGELTVDDFSLTGTSQMFISPEQIIEIQSLGHEIGSHTQTHPYLTAIPLSEARQEIFGAKNDLFNMGASPVDVFAYPYGDYNAAVQQIVRDAGHTGARSVNRGFNTKSTDKYALKIQQVDITTTISEAQTWINSAIKNKTWLVLCFHQIDNNGGLYGTTPEIMQNIIDYIVLSNVSVVTASQGIQLMNP